MNRDASNTSSIPDMLLASPPAIIIVQYRMLGNPRVLVVNHVLWKMWRPFGSCKLLNATCHTG